MKPFDLEAFKKGQKALTRNGLVATFVGVCNECRASNRITAHIQGYDSVFTYFASGIYPDEDNRYSPYDLVSMVSRHQALIDSYDPEDAWQVYNLDAWNACEGEPNWHEGLDYRLHPHNDLIKARKKGAKIEVYVVRDWVEEPDPDWDEDTQYRIKSEPVIHCLAYDAKRFNYESTTAVRARVVKKEVAQANGWKIIQEWEV